MFSRLRAGWKRSQTARAAAESERLLQYKRLAISATAARLSGRFPPFLLPTLSPAPLLVGALQIASADSADWCRRTIACRRAAALLRIATFPPGAPTSPSNARHRRRFRTRVSSSSAFCNPWSGFSIPPIDTHPRQQAMCPARFQLVLRGSLPVRFHAARVFSSSASALPIRPISLSCACRSTEAFGAGPRRLCLSENLFRQVERRQTSPVRSLLPKAARSSAVRCQFQIPALPVASCSRNSSASRPTV